MQKIKQLILGSRAISIMGQVVLWVMFFLFPLHLYNVRIMDPHFFQRQLLDNIFFVLLFYVNVSYLLPNYLIRGRKVKYFIGVLVLLLVVIAQQLITERAFQPPMWPRFGHHKVTFHAVIEPNGAKGEIRLDSIQNIPPDKLGDSAFIKKYGLPPRPVILPREGAFNPDRPGGPHMGAGVRWFRDMDDFAFVMVIRRAFSTSLLLLMVGSIWKLSFVWSRAEKERETLQKEKLSAELKLLKSQINPHFLFNVLNSLYALSYKEQSKVSTSILKLSYIMRYMIYDTNRSAVPLQKEVDYIKNYIALQRLRMPDFVDITCKAEGIQEGHCIEPMLLLPFIENAFKHGVSYLTPSKINIRLQVKEDELFMEVDNPIVRHRVSGANEQGGVGLTNVRERLKLLYGNHYLLKIEQDRQRYYVRLQISLNKIKKDLYD
ncbi:sensor histidine kinase [Arachidicoccus terrestris]|uniref:sensor histidine kinase n=1 Tax=Arachidicoccus terrestris TaxID=2875539 RepID=UPI001CC4A474|nr:histidine kinase [Arachidicoccus terrestris]UAY56845.1 histidine kinase [Arachidicoccus terrestris]